MTYRRMLYIFAIIKRNHFKMYMFGVVGETLLLHIFIAHDFVIALLHMCNLDTKETEISQKRRESKTER